MNLFRIGQVYSENGNTHWRIDTDGMTVVEVINSPWGIGERYKFPNWETHVNRWINEGIFTLVYDKEDNVKKILNKVDESERTKI